MKPHFRNIKSYMTGVCSKSKATAIAKTPQSLLLVCCCTGTQLSLTSSNQRLGECVRSKMDSQISGKRARSSAYYNAFQYASNGAKRGISSRNVLEDRLRDEPKEHLCAK